MSSNCTAPTNDFSFHKQKMDIGIGVGVGLTISFIISTRYRFIRLDKDGHHPVRSVNATEISWTPDVPVSNPEKTKGQVLWYKKKAIINIVSIIANALQLSAFAFSPSVPWSDGSKSGFRIHLDTIFNTFLVQWGDQLFKIAFWILICFALLFSYILMPCSGLFMVMCKNWVGSFNDAETEKPLLHRSSSISYKMVAVLTTILDLFGLSILTLLFAPLNCTYYEDLPPTLDIDPSIECWKGPHLVYASFAIIVLVPLYTWSLMVQIAGHEEGMAHCFRCCCDVAPFYIEDHKDEVICHYKWAFYYTQLKLVIAAGNAFFSHHSYVRLIILLVCDILIFTLSCLVSVNQYKMHNILRRISILFAVWTVICGFIAQLICNPAQWDSFLIWICGLVVLLIIGIIILRKKYTSELYTKLWQESSSDYGIVNNKE